MTAILRAQLSTLTKVRRSLLQQQDEGEKAHGGRKGSGKDSPAPAEADPWQRIKPWVPRDRGTRKSSRKETARRTRSREAKRRAVESVSEAAKARNESRRDHNVRALLEQSRKGRRSRYAKRLLLDRQRRSRAEEKPVAKELDDEEFDRKYGFAPDVDSASLFEGLDADAGGEADLDGGSDEEGF